MFSTGVLFFGRTGSLWAGGGEGAADLWRVGAGPCTYWLVLILLTMAAHSAGSMLFVVNAGALLPLEIYIIIVLPEIRGL